MENIKLNANDDFAPVDYALAPNRTEFRECTWEQKHSHRIADFFLDGEKTWCKEES